MEIKKRCEELQHTVHAGTVKLVVL